MDKKNNITLLFAGANAGLNNHVILAATPATEEFRHSSPVLIISSTNKNSGIKQAKLSRGSGGNVFVSDDLRPDL
jgi:hypothetical protein